MVHVGSQAVLLLGIMCFVFFVFSFGKETFHEYECSEKFVM